MELTCEQISALFLVFDDNSVRTNLVRTATTSHTTTDHSIPLMDVLDHLRSCHRCQNAYQDLPVAWIGLRSAPENRPRAIVFRKPVRPSEPAPSGFERLQRSDPNYHPYQTPMLVEIACRSSAISSNAAPSDTDYSGSTKDGSLWQKEVDFSDEDSPSHSPGIGPGIPEKVASPEDYLGVGEQPFSQIDMPAEVVDVQSEVQPIEFLDTTVTNSGLHQPKRVLEQCDPRSGESIGFLTTLLDTGAVRNMIREDMAMEAGFKVDPNFKPPGTYCWGNSNQLVKVIGEHKVYAYDSETEKAMKIVADVVPADQFTPGCDFIMSFKALSRTGHWSIQADGIVLHFTPANDC